MMKLNCSCSKFIYAVLEKFDSQSPCILNKTNLNFANFQQRFNCLTLIHFLVGFVDIIKRGRVSENSPRIDIAFEYSIKQ